MSLPPRDYELAGCVLAEAAERAKRDGTPITRAIEDVAREQGREIALETKRQLNGRASAKQRRLRFLEALGALGFEPAESGGDVVLMNCPFHHLAQSHTELICGMNLSLLDGALDELGDTGWAPQLQPCDGRCCVQLHPESA